MKILYKNEKTKCDGMHATMAKEAISKRKAYLDEHFKYGCFRIDLVGYYTDVANA